MCSSSVLLVCIEIERLRCERGKSVSFLHSMLRLALARRFFSVRSVLPAVSRSARHSEQG